MEKVSVIIPTFNRFKYLLNTIDSVKSQTYSNLEIIVINDNSKEKEYYEYDWVGNNITIIHLEQNSKNKFNYPCVGYVRNKGIEKSTGVYIAFCDDDDIWFPKKIELQLKAMKKTGCDMSSTDGLIGKGIYDKNTKYKKFNEEHYYKTIQNIYRSKNSNLLENGFPEIWTLDFLKINNCVINSSVMVKKNILEKAGLVPYDRRGQDYKCWLNVLKYTNSIYLTDICFYYDSNHGAGSNH